MNEVRDVYLIECKRCGNRHWIALDEMRASEEKMRAALRCECGARGDALDIGRVSLPYDLGFEAILYEGWPGKGPYQVIARCSANTYAHVLFDWIAKQYPTNRYVISDSGRIVKDTGERGP